MPDSPGVAFTAPREARPEDPLGVVEAATGVTLADVVFWVTGVPDAVVDQLDDLRERGGSSCRPARGGRRPSPPRPLRRPELSRSSAPTR